MGLVPKCDHCDGLAAYISTKFVKGRPQHTNLCADCAASQGKPPEPTKCPTCGNTAAAVKDGHQLGCPSCYTTFTAALRPILKALHRGTRHTGKRPLYRANAAPLQTP